MSYPKELFKGGESRTVENAAQEANARVLGFTEPYDRNQPPYPRSLYKDGRREVDPVNGNEIKADHVIVRNEEEEKAARAKGYRILGEEPEKKVKEK